MPRPGRRTAPRRFIAPQFEPWYRTAHAPSPSKPTRLPRVVTPSPYEESVGVAEVGVHQVDFQDFAVRRRHLLVDLPELAGGVLRFDGLAPGDRCFGPSSSHFQFHRAGAGPHVDDAQVAGGRRSLRFAGADVEATLVQRFLDHPENRGGKRARREPMRRARGGRRSALRSPEWREGCSHPGAMEIGEFADLLLRCPEIAERIREAF